MQQALRLQSVLAFLGFLSSSVAAVADAGVQPVAHYELGRGAITYAAGPETLADKSGDHDLARHGDPVFFADAPPHATGGSLKFDADWYGKSSAIGSAGDDFALEAWVKAARADDAGLHGVVSNGDGAQGYTIAQQGALWVAFVGGVGAFPMAEVSSDHWVHLALVADGADCKLYVDGREVGTFRRCAALRPSFAIGDMGHGNETFTGLIHEVRLSTFERGRFDPAADLLLDYDAVRKAEASARHDRAELIDGLTQPHHGTRAVKEILVPPVAQDWLVAPVDRRSELLVDAADDRQSASLVLTNGLASRTFRVADNLASVSLRNLSNDAEFLRAIKPEARVKIDGTWYDVGGLEGQPEKSYLIESWFDELRADPTAFRFVGLETSEPAARYPWKVKFNAVDTPWPPRGLQVALRFAPPIGQTKLDGIAIRVHYEIYDGLPVIAKWLTIDNAMGRDIVVDETECEILAVCQDQRERLHVESDYAFAAANFHERGSALLHFQRAPQPYQMGGGTTDWRVDPEYSTWATHNAAEDLFLDDPHHCLLVSRPPMGPGERIADGGAFQSIVTFELLHDSDDRERQALGHRRLYRRLAPQVTESLLTFAITSHDRGRLEALIDQMAALGFERLDIHPWPGIRHDNLDPKYVAHWKGISDYCRERGIILGGYELAIASRGRGAQVDCIDPATGKPGSLFGQSVCIASAWKDEYFAKTFEFFDRTGFMSWNADGPYHGDPCASTGHAHHAGLIDSQWQQWKAQVEVIHEFQRRGCYLPIPDWYFLNGQCATGMGYREASANLSPQQQLLLGRQYIYDGTWHKTPTMGWMTLQLVGFYTSDPRVGLEPLADNLERYERGLVQHLGAGCQFTVRGNRLWDTPETKAMVEKWIGWYKRYRSILTSDIIHLGRPTGRDLDCMLHVNPELDTRGLAVVFNPTSRDIARDLELPLYYAGLSDAAMVREREGRPVGRRLDREYRVRVPVSIPAGGFTWLVVEAPKDPAPRSSRPESKRASGGPPRRP